MFKFFNLLALNFLSGTNFSGTILICIKNVCRLPNHLLPDRNKQTADLLVYYTNTRICVTKSNICIVS